MAREDGDNAGDLLLIDRLLHERVQALQALGGKADCLGLDDGEIDCGWGSTRTPGTVEEPAMQRASAATSASRASKCESSGSS